jgi:hypothetical protein
MPATQMSVNNRRHAATICTKHNVLPKIWKGTFITLFSDVLSEIICVHKLNKATTTTKPTNEPTNQPNSIKQSFKSWLFHS